MAVAEYAAGCVLGDGVADCGCGRKVGVCGSERNDVVGEFGPAQIERSFAQQVESHVVVGEGVAVVVAVAGVVGVVGSHQTTNGTSTAPVIGFTKSAAIERPAATWLARRGRRRWL